MEKQLFLVNFYKLLDILIEKEREEKEKCLNNWTVSEYAFHNGKESAFSEMKREISFSLIPD